MCGQNQKSKQQQQDEESLRNAAKDGDVNEVRRLVEQAGVNVDSTDPYNRTPLLFASMYGQVKVAEILLNEYHADPNHSTDGGFSPLHISAVSSCESMVQLLLSRGANKNMTTKDGQTAVDVAQERGCMKIVAILKAGE